MRMRRMEHPGNSKWKLDSANRFSDPQNLYVPKNLVKIRHLGLGPFSSPLSLRMRRNDYSYSSKWKIDDVNRFADPENLYVFEILAKLAHLTFRRQPVSASRIW